MENNPILCEIYDEFKKIEQTLVYAKFCIGKSKYSGAINAISEIQLETDKVRRKLESVRYESFNED